MNPTPLFIHIIWDYRLLSLAGYRTACDQYTHLLLVVTAS